MTLPTHRPSQVQTSLKIPLRVFFLSQRSWVAQIGILKWIYILHFHCLSQRKGPVTSVILLDSRFWLKFCPQSAFPVVWLNPGVQLKVCWTLCGWLWEVTVSKVVQSLGRVQPFVTPGTGAHQAPLSMGFSRSGVGCHLLLQGIFPTGYNGL